MNGTTRVVFTVMPEPPSAVQVVPPVAHFPAGAITLDFHNITDYTVEITCPASGANPNPLTLRSHERGSINVPAAKSGEIFVCDTEILWSSCPACHTAFEAPKALRQDGGEAAAGRGEPIIIIDEA